MSITTRSSLVSYHSWCSIAVLLVVDFTIRAQDCTSPIGIEKGDIPDDKISASSYYDEYSSAARGRLNIEYQPPKKSGWCAAGINQEQYLEIDLEADSEITGIATQGRGREPYEHWVSKYYVSFRTNDGPWINLTDTEESRPKIFSGNADGFVSKFHSFNRTIKARYVRIHPVEWNIQICMRVELYGCLGKNLVLEDNDLLIFCIILLAMVFCFVIMLLLLLLTMRRLLKVLERRLTEKVRRNMNTFTSTSVGHPKEDQTPRNTTENKNNDKGETSLYARVKKENEENGSNNTTDKEKNKVNKKYKDSSDPKIILVMADEEDAKQRKKRASHNEKQEMIDL